MQEKEEAQETQRVRMTPGHGPQEVGADRAEAAGRQGRWGLSGGPHAADEEGPGEVGSAAQEAAAGWENAAWASEAAGVLAL